MNRRFFLKGLVIGAAAPAVVRAESLMKIWVPPTEIALPHYRAEITHEGFRLIYDGTGIFGSEGSKGTVLSICAKSGDVHIVGKFEAVKSVRI